MAVSLFIWWYAEQASWVAPLIGDGDQRRERDSGEGIRHPATMNARYDGLVRSERRFLIVEA